MIRANKVNKDVRAELVAQLGEPVPDRAWDYLVSEGKVEKVRLGEKAIHWLEDEAWRLDAATGGKLFDGREKPSRSFSMIVRREKELINDRDEALSMFYAIHARWDSRVTEFRSDVLKNRLVAPGAVESWLRRAAENETGPRYLLSDVPFNGEIDDTNGALTPSLHLTTWKGGYRSGRRGLAYGMPGDTAARYIDIPVGSTGVLDRLYEVGQSLCRAYGWGEAEATLFLLTDQVPPFRSVLSTTSAPAHNLLRITLRIDPSATPRQVANVYKAIRSRMVKKRIRTLTRKHMTLAVFTTERPEDESWQKRMTIWNRTYLQHKYSNEGNFRRDALAAVTRLERGPGQAFYDLMRQRSNVQKLGGNHGRERSTTKKR